VMTAQNLSQYCIGFDCNNLDHGFLFVRAVNQRSKASLITNMEVLGNRKNDIKVNACLLLLCSVNICFIPPTSYLPNNLKYNLDHHVLNHIISSTRVSNML